MFAVLPDRRTFYPDHEQINLALRDHNVRLQDQEERVNWLGLGIILHFLERFQQDIDDQLDEVFGRDPMWLR